MWDLSESEAPKAAMEIPCAWRVVTQKRETVLFGAGDGGGWSSGADACLGGADEGVVTKEVWPDLCSDPGWERGSEELPGQARAGHAMVCPRALTEG